MRRKAFIINREAVQIGKTLYHFPTREKIAMPNYPRKGEYVTAVRVKDNSWASAQEALDKVERR